MSDVILVDNAWLSRIVENLSRPLFSGERAQQPFCESSSCLFSHNDLEGEGCFGVVSPFFLEWKTFYRPTTQTREQQHRRDRLSRPKTCLFLSLRMDEFDVRIIGRFSLDTHGIIRERVR